jgi:hypothetical protein
MKRYSEASMKKDYTERKRHLVPGKSGKIPRKDCTTSKRVLKTYHPQKHRKQATSKHYITRSWSN